MIRSGTEERTIKDWKCDLGNFRKYDKISKCVRILWMFPQNNKTHLNLRKSAAKIENSPSDSPLQYRMFVEYNLALRSMSLTEKRIYLGV